MGVTIKLNYSKSALKALNVELKEDVMSAVTSSSALRKEIQKTFQQANRRIQNIQNSGVFSPAVEGLGSIMNTSKFTKFSMVGDWATLKQRYARCVSFLNQPTSTATGAKQYVKYLAQREGISEERAQELARYLYYNEKTVGDDFVNSYKYPEFLQELHEAVKDVSDIMEQEAIQNEESLDASLDSGTQAIATQGTDTVENWFEIFNK